MVDTDDPSPNQADKEARREKHKKRMNKILFKAWNLPNAQPFQESTHPSDNEVRDLTAVGQNLDNGSYEHGRSGWELFARDMGFVYNWHIIRNGKHVSTAKNHVEKVVGFFSKVDHTLGDLVTKSIPSEQPSESVPKKHSPGSKKRKHYEREPSESSPKKKTDGGGNEPLTLSQREKRAMDMLASYLEECGGEREQSDHFRCKVVQRPGGRFESIFFSTENRRFKSMVDVARFLNLVNDRPNNTHSGSSRSSRSANRSHKDSEKKKLKRELDKLMKLHVKAVKALDDHKNENPVNQFPIDDESLWYDGSNAATAHKDGKVLPQSDIESFPGIPTHCIPDLLVVWDFLCTFCRALSLEPIELDDFAAALSFRPTQHEQNSSLVEESDQSTYSYIPVYLSESHISLLRLLLQDPTSDNWWWSTLETPEMVEEEGDDYLNAADKKRKTASAVVKVDMEGLLAVEEDPTVTTRWLQALEDVRTRKPDNSGPIKSAVRTAIAVTKNQLVKLYLKKAMRKWRPRSAGLVKRAVVWLVDRVREARPNIWGRQVGEDEVAEQKKMVATEAALEMEKIVEDADEDNGSDMNFEEDSEEDSYSDDDESSDIEEDEYADQTENSSPANQSCSVTLKENDDITPVTSPVPVKPVPSLVDLLLPPAKPSHTSDLVHSLTWPPVIGATTCRVLHWYKRRRNEVDDSIREFRELRPMSVAERRRRELSAPSRILSECAAASDEEPNHVENAINHLCDGKDYLDLTAVQRLCILRILVEAAYDTYRVQQSVDDNFKARINAVKALDAEERRAKKEAREEIAAIESAARERLAREAREAFVDKKRQEIIQNNQETREYTSDFVENLTDNDVIDFDEDTKAEYDALPPPESFSKSEVNAVVTKIQEETAFETQILVVLSLKEIEQREEDHLKSLRTELESFGNIDSVYQNHSADRETSAKIDRLKRDIASCTQSAQSLPKTRSLAIEALKDAIDDGTVKTLRSAVKTAKLARLSGDDEETGGVWALDFLRDAAIELKNAEGRKRVTEAQKDLIAKRNKCFIRTEPLGRDRFQSCFIHFDYDKNSRVWAERDVVVCDNDSELLKNGEETAVLFKSVQSASICDPDKEEDFLSQDDAIQPYGMSFLEFARQEYHHSAKLSTLAAHHWSCYTTDRSLRILIKNLDGKCARESALKEVLKGTLEAMTLASAGNDTYQAVNSGNMSTHNELLDTGVPFDETAAEKKVISANDKDFYTSGDEKIFSDGKQNASVNDADVLKNIHSAIGKRIRLRRIPDPERAPDVAQYTMGTITGWKMETAHSAGNLSDDMSGDSRRSTDQSPIWRLGLDEGGELYVSVSEVIDGITRAIKWSTQYPGYIEHDAPFLSYRNGLGRFCGRAVDAPSSLTPLAFAKQLLKKEQDYYMPLKNRTYENNWGGKCGARNAWVASLKEYGHTFDAVRDGLLTLENAFFDLAGGFGSDVSSPENSGVETSGDKVSGKDLLYDDVSRFDIELESLGNEVKGLWNSSDTRDIFREIITTCKTVSILALGLDLICRNCQAYIGRTKSSVVQTPRVDQSAVSAVGSRRSAMQRPGAYSAFF